MRTVTYAIGDVHGRLDLLDQLLGLIEADADRRGAHSKIVFTGDYVDRGADTRGVVERLMAGPRRAGDSFVPLRGNHDVLFARAATHGRDVPDWAWLLFWHTLRSYGLDRDGSWRGDPTLLSHAAYLADLPLTHEDGPNLFVHAGIRPGVPLDRQSEEDLTWIREPFLLHDGPLPWRVVHGHTIMGDRPVVLPHRVSIDTGAFRSGLLTAAVFDGADVTVLQAVGPPDRGALVREALLVETIAGRTVSTAMRRVFDAFEAGDIDAVEMEQRLRRAA